MEKSYVVIVDSMADFEIGYKDPNVVIVDTPVTIGGDDYTNVNVDDFYRRQREVYRENKSRRDLGDIPISIKTSTPSPAILEEAMYNILLKGKDAVYVSTSSTLSSAYQSGRIAVDAINDAFTFDNKAIVIDGLSMSCLTALLVRTALEKCDTTEEFVEFILDRRNDTEHFFIITDWNAFRDSGRIPPLTLAIARIAGIKPLMRYDFDNEGNRKPFCEKRSRLLIHLYSKIIEMMEDTIDGDTCVIANALNPEGMNTICDLISNKMPNIKILTGPNFRMGNATGVHLGYSAVGVAFLRKKNLYAGAEKSRELRDPYSVYGIDI